MRVLFITGASRGIGRAIAHRFAKENACIALIAKTDTPHPTLEGTIHTVAEEVRELGGYALPLAVDVRNEDQVKQAMEKTVSEFGRLDVLINNASAIYLADTVSTPMKRYDLIQAVNARATFVCSQAAIPYLSDEKGDRNSHILTLSPPLSFKPKDYAAHLAYTLSKMGMSMCTLGLAEELKSKNIAVNSLWPKSTIATDAIRVNFPPAIYQASRHPSIVAEAAYRIIEKPVREATGQFYIDEDILRQAGITDFSSYAVDPKVAPFLDLFL